MEHRHLQPDLSPLVEDGVGGQVECKQEMDIRAPTAPWGVKARQQVSREQSFNRIPYDRAGGGSQGGPTPSLGGSTTHPSSHPGDPSPLPPP